MVSLCSSNYILASLFFSYDTPPPHPTQTQIYLYRIKTVHVYQVVILLGDINGAKTRAAFLCEQERFYTLFPLCPHA